MLTLRNDFVIKSYHISHSKLILSTLGQQEENIEIVFEGVHYLELPRICYGLKISKSTDDQIQELLKRRKRLEGKKVCYWTIESLDEYYVIAAFSFQFYIDGKPQSSPS